ncbi:ABC transporter [uncultured Mycolicibacterium sp.]|uniref:ABC transporter n=1 Tax=uncultured Mycolicibacterium sp. TaxID=2320817 RepID=UPI002613D6FB|nr:ABC transporter [uncultured Mycolicibacterium sp.]
MTFSNRRLYTAVYLITLAVYLGVAYWVQLRHGYLMGDALSRVQAAESVLYSRYPHLAAVGFIFTPLTAMVQLPVILLAPLWHTATDYGLSGSVMSALFMAGAVVHILGIGIDRGLPRGYALTIAALFAFNPMIVFYGSNGMSEALFLFFVGWAVRRLIRWMSDDDVHHLVVAGGIAMGLAYLTRYDAVAILAVSGVLVATTTFLRARPYPRIRRTVLDLFMVSGPGVLAFFAWAAASWLITGEAFAQFTSQYGNAAILRQSGGTDVTFGAGLSFAMVCITLLAPTLLPLLGCAVATRRRSRHWTALLVPVLLYGSALAFQSLSYATGSTFGFLRFYITAIPLAATLAMLAVPDGTPVPAARPGRYAPPAPAVPPRAPRWVYAAAALLLAAGLPVTTWGMTLPKYAPQEYALRSIVAPDPDDTDAQRADERRILRTFAAERRLAHYLDRLDLPDSSVLVDTVYGFGIIAASARPRTFVIPSDRDFVGLLNDPVGSGVRYLLAVPNEGRGTSDALNMRYPTLYDTGADIATLELEIPNDGDNQPPWRLYRVNAPVEPGRRTAPG